MDLGNQTRNACSNGSMQITKVLVFGYVDARALAGPALRLRLMSVATTGASEPDVSAADAVPPSMPNHHLLVPESNRAPSYRHMTSRSPGVRSAARAVPEAKKQ